MGEVLNYLKTAVQLQTSCLMRTTPFIQMDVKIFLGRQYSFLQLKILGSCAFISITSVLMHWCTQL